MDALMAITHWIDNTGGLALSGADQLELAMSWIREIDAVVDRSFFIQSLLRTKEDILVKLVQLGLFDVAHLWLQAALEPGDSNGDEEEIDSKELLIDILKLIKILPLTVSHLRQNDTGRRLKKLLKDSNEEIVALAQTIIANWKVLISKSNDKSKRVASKITSPAQSVKHETPEKKKAEKPISASPHNSSVQSKDKSMQSDKDSFSRSILRGAYDPDSKHQPRKSVSFMEDEKLVECHYFELSKSEIENLNNLKSVTEMRKNEIALERNVYRKNLGISYIKWSSPMELDNPFREKLVISSNEMVIQKERIKSTLRDIFFNIKNLSAYEPEVPSEPDPNHKIKIIPFVLSSNEVYGTAHKNSINPQFQNQMAAMPPGLMNPMMNPMVMAPGMPFIPILPPTQSISSQNSIQENLRLILSTPQNVLPNTAGAKPTNIQGQQNLRNSQRDLKNIKCFHYFNKGWCKFKDKCQYSHEGKANNDNDNNNAVVTNNAKNVNNKNTIVNTSPKNANNSNNNGNTTNGNK